jgi:uncharacterized protein
MKKRRKPTKKAAARIPRIVSIPPGVVLAPSSELPPHPRGVDRSAARRAARELTWSQFERLMQSLAEEVLAEFKPQAVVGIAHGGVFVGGALARTLDCEFFPVRISRRSRDRVVRQKPKTFGLLPPELRGRRVLLVDDVASSGDTLQLAQTLLDKVGAKEVRTACLVRRANGFETDWSATVSNDLFVFPWDYEPLTEDGRFGV